MFTLLKKTTRDSAASDTVIDEKSHFCKAFSAGGALFPVIHCVLQFVHVVWRNALGDLQTLILI